MFRIAGYAPLRKTTTNAAAVEAAGTRRSQMSLIHYIKKIKIDVRSKDCLYITIGKWVIYIDNSTGEKIIDTWKE